MQGQKLTFSCMIKIKTSPFHRDTGVLQGTKDKTETTTEDYQERNSLSCTETVFFCFF